MGARATHVPIIQNNNKSFVFSNLRLAERVGFVPAIGSPINDLGLIGSSQSSRTTRNPRTQVQNRYSDSTMPSAPHGPSPAAGPSQPADAIHSCGDVFRNRPSRSAVSAGCPRALARLFGRSDRRRRHSRPAGASGSPARARRPLATKGAAGEARGGLRPAVDAARPMETTDRFPQVFGKPHRPRFPTAPTASSVVCRKNKTKPRNPLYGGRTHYTAGRPSVASLRS